MRLGDKDFKSGWEVRRKMQTDWWRGYKNPPCK